MRDMFLIFENKTETNGVNIKTKDSVEIILNRLQTYKTRISFITTIKTQKGYETAIKFKSDNSPRCESVRKHLEEVFPDYKIFIDTNDKTSYLQKARKLICPIDDVLIDPYPYIFGEDKRSLCYRIQNSGRGDNRSASKRTNLQYKIRACLEEKGDNYEIFITTRVYLDNAWKYPYTMHAIWE